MIKIAKKIFFKYKEVILYLFFGGLTTLISWVTSVLLFYQFNVGNIPSNVISWIISVAFAYATNKTFVFESKSNNILTEMLRFFSARLFSLAIDLLIMKVGVDVFMFNFGATKAVSQIFVIIFNYFASKLFIFKKK
ncbi:MAG: GtrA family protein [Clostridiales bacterium]|jgi:putative flippase GtrA|nr:GtrA family protein [Clostridiales bacterium]